MSDYYRLKRLVKSIIPRFPDGNDRQYTPSDARLIITDLAMNISPENLEALVENDMILDDFIGSLYELEHEVRKKIVNDLGVIDPTFLPKAYQEGGVVGFAISYRGEDLIFAEYRVA